MSVMADSKCRYYSSHGAHVIDATYILLKSYFTQK